MKLQYKSYDDLPLWHKIVGQFYGVKRSTWINLGMYYGENEVEKKLGDITAPFWGFLCIVGAGGLQVFCVLASKP